MILENTVTFILHLQTCVQDFEIIPCELENIIRPKEIKRSAWIPSTLDECVWLWYEFNNIEEKENYLKKLHIIFNEKFIDIISHKSVDQKFIDNFTKDDDPRYVSYSALQGIRSPRDNLESGNI